MRIGERYDARKPPFDGDRVFEQDRERGEADRPREACRRNRFAAGQEQGSGVLPEQEWLVALGRTVRESSDVRYRSLAAALRDAIANGRLPVGAKLPPERDLAAFLSIGRTTVVSAYNLLQAESLIVTKQGAGTFVARRP
jgi:regulatory GntR family protein